MYSVDQEMKYFKTSPHLEEDGISSLFLKGLNGGLILEESKQRGYYFLKGIDSGRDEMTWNRFKLFDELEGDVVCEVYILVTDCPFSEINGKLVDRDRVLQSEAISPKEKLRLLVEEGAKIYTNHKDILLHGLEGRYLWVAITCYNLEAKSYILKGLEIEYPMQTFVDYLPEIYTEGGEFLRRYMGIFQSLYLDVERQIDHLTEYLDVDTTPERFLNELGSWVGIDNSEGIFSAQQMRQIIPKAAKINSGKGTKSILEEVITIYTGVKPIIIEYFKWAKLVKSEKDKAVYKKLYGSEWSHFTVIIQEGKEKINREKLQLLIEQYKPAMTISHLVILEKAQRSDWHCYLGVNSYLAEFSEAKLNHMRLMGDSIMKLG